MFSMRLFVALFLTTIVSYRSVSFAGELFSPTSLRSIAENFEVSSVSGVSLKPQCLRNHGLDLIVIDAGHDDSILSRRSEAKRCPDCPTEVLRPLIHEGQLNAAVSNMIFDMMMKDASLTSQERAELRSMVRLSRHPGEVLFGEYEVAMGRLAQTNGPIRPNTENRLEHINIMMNQHLDASGVRRDVTSRTLIQMIHANNASFYDRADYLWILRPLQMSPIAWEYFQSLARGFQQEMQPYFSWRKSDPQLIRELKDAVRPHYHEDRTKMDHSDVTRMLRPGLGNEQTIRALSEGFFMDGKAGNLVHREISNPSHNKYLSFYRENQVVARYIISDLYVQYARSVVRGIGERFGCRN